MGVDTKKEWIESHDTVALHVSLLLSLRIVQIQTISTVLSVYLTKYTLRTVESSPVKIC